MTAPSDVLNLGTDSSGRTIYATAYMRDWLTALARHLGWTPTVIQGGFMVRNGGGAASSAGYHDGGGCIDFRTRDLTAQQTVSLVRECRRGGAGAWLRDAQHGGMDPHVHIVLGADSALTSGAAWQWSRYLVGRDGLAGGGPDYHWRPDPLITTPPTAWLQEDDMATYADQLDRIEATGKATAAAITRLDARVKNTNAKLGRANALLRKVRADVKDTATLAEIDALLAEDDD